MNCKPWIPTLMRSKISIALEKHSSMHFTFIPACWAVGWRISPSTAYSWRRGEHSEGTGEGEKGIAVKKWAAELAQNTRICFGNRLLNDERRKALKTGKPKVRKWTSTSSPCFKVNTRLRHTLARMAVLFQPLWPFARVSLQGTASPLGHHRGSVVPLVWARDMPEHDCSTHTPKSPARPWLEGWKWHQPKHTVSKDGFVSTCVLFRDR